MTVFYFATAVPLLAMLVVATYTDLRWRLIPNGLSFGAALVAVFTHATYFGIAGAAVAVLGWALCLLFFMPFYFGGGMAGGDVKLMAAVGAFVGPLDGAIACALTLIAGSVIGSLSVGWRKRTSKETHIPYALAIVMGTAAVVLQPSLASIVTNGGWA